MQKETSPPMTDRPLSMSVHELPELSAQSELIQNKSSRWMVWLVLLVCAAPVIMSYLTYYVIRPQARAVNGELIEPLRGLPDVPATPEGSAQPIQLGELKGQWLLVSVDSGACDKACQDKLYIQRQLIVSLGKEQDRIERVWLIADQNPIAPDIQPGLSQARVLRVSGQALSDWLSMDSAPKGEVADGQALQELKKYFYLVDPMGQLMERFVAGADRDSAMKVKKDLDKLLRASASWDQAGR